MARKYVRDNRGRFASTGSGATARGGRLKTASGNKRATQTMRAAGAGGVIKARAARTVAGEKVMAKMAKRVPAAKRISVARPAIKTGTIKPKQTISDKQFWRLAQKAQVPSRQENWGGRDRKQGKRVGNMVIGAMSAAQRGIKSYPDYRRARGMTSKVWNEAKLMSDEGKRATIGALQAGWRPSRALRLGYQF